VKSQKLDSHEQVFFRECGLAQNHFVLNLAPLRSLTADHFHLCETPHSFNLYLMHRPQPEFLSFQVDPSLREVPLFGYELQFFDSGEVRLLKVGLMPGVEIDEELHLFADALPDG